MRKIKQALKILMDNGLINGAKIIIKILKRSEIHELVQVKHDVFSFYNYILFDKNEAQLKKIEGNVKLLWFIPDFGIGSGGHLNIFRMIFNLEKLGMKSDIVICGYSQWVNEFIAKQTIDNNFFQLSSRIYFVNNESDIKKLDKYHVGMATSWQTAYYVNNFSNCINKFYFVQDFEPFFYPRGSSFVFAENTYKFGFSGISAGSWISTKLTTEYGMECTPFSFSYDKELYLKHKKRDDKKRVFFYARPPTDRRGFELGLFALNELYKKDAKVEFVLAGWDTSEYKIPFPHLNAGVLSISELSDLYSQCNVALVLSFTNLSLLPLEILASGCEVLLNDGDNNTWLDPHKKLFNYVSGNVTDIVNGLLDILDGTIEKDQNYINNFLENSSWGKEASIVYNKLLEKVD